MMEGKITATRPSRLLPHAANLLHAVDLDNDLALFIPTSRLQLSEAAFIDGRTDIALGPPELVRITELMRSVPREPTPLRVIFHLSFGGSTFLSRLIDVKGQSLVLKEPNCLVDLANWKSKQLRAGRSTEHLRPALSLVTDTLRRPFGLGEAVTVKPSSWANNLLEDFVALDGQLLPLFVTIDRPAFLQAVFRGGTERLRFTGQLASQIASAFTDGDALLHAAISGAGDPLGRAANLAMVAHFLQMRTFERAIDQGGWSAERVIDFQTIIESPFDAARKACRALRLSVERSDLERSVRRHVGKHSKNPGVGYSAAFRRADDQAVLDHHAVTLNTALLWADRNLGASRSLGSKRELAA